MKPNSSQNSLNSCTNPTLSSSSTLSISSNSYREGRRWGMCCEYSTKTPGLKPPPAVLQSYQHRSPSMSSSNGLRTTNDITSMREHLAFPSSIGSNWESPRSMLTKGRMLTSSCKTTSWARCLLPGKTGPNKWSSWGRRSTRNSYRRSWMLGTSTQLKRGSSIGTSEV